MMMYGNGLTKFQRWQRPKQHPKSHDAFLPGSPPTVVDALTQKQYGEFETAIQILTTIASSHSEEVELARYELALLYAQLGKDDDANEQLHHLHFKFRLSPSILVPGSASGHLSSATKIPKTVVVKAVDNVLPLPLLQHLQHVFHAGSPFFIEHDYPTEQFFSYNINLQQSTDGTKTLMHQVAEHLRPIIETTFPHKFISSSTESVEFWCHARDASSAFAHQLHFDLDEEALRQASASSSTETTSSKSSNSHGKSIISKSCLHPLVSCVLYLSAHDTTEGQRSCAPTLVTDQTLDAGSVASEGWLCYPKLNRLLMFDGSFLHGIVPHLSVTKGSSTPRVTLMLGFWGKTFDTTTSPITKTLGPNMPIPSWNVHKTWPRLLEAISLPSKSKTSTKTKPSMTDGGIVHIPGPIWIPLTMKDHHQHHHNEVSLTITNTDMVEFISMDELHALRDKDQNHRQKTTKRSTKLNNIPMATSHFHPTKKTKNSVNAWNTHPKQEISDQIEEDAVEYVSMSVLEQLRTNKSIHSSNQQDIQSKCSEEGGYVFVGKWFVKSLSEIRDDVLQGGNIKLIA